MAASGLLSHVWLPRYVEGVRFASSRPCCSAQPSAPCVDTPPRESIHTATVPEALQVSQTTRKSPSGKAYLSVRARAACRLLCSVLCSESGGITCAAGVAVFRWKDNRCCYTTLLLPTATQACYGPSTTAALDETQHAHQRKEDLFLHPSAA